MTLAGVDCALEVSTPTTTLVEGEPQLDLTVLITALRGDVANITFDPDPLLDVATTPLVVTPTIPTARAVGALNDTWIQAVRQTEVMMIMNVDSPDPCVDVLDGILPFQVVDNERRLFVTPATRGDSCSMMGTPTSCWDTFCATNQGSAPGTYKALIGIANFRRPPPTNPLDWPLLPSAAYWYVHPAGGDGPLVLSTNSLAIPTGAVDFGASNALQDQAWLALRDFQMEVGTCAEWTSPSGTVTGVNLNAINVDTSFYATLMCSESHRVICVETP